MKAPNVYSLRSVCVCPFYWFNRRLPPGLDQNTRPLGNVSNVEKLPASQLCNTISICGLAQHAFFSVRIFIRTAWT